MAKQEDQGHMTSAVHQPQHSNSYVETTRHPGDHEESNGRGPQADLRYEACRLFLIFAVFVALQLSFEYVRSAWMAPPAATKTFRENLARACPPGADGCTFSAGSGGG